MSQDPTPQNPLEALAAGLGGLDIGGMLQQAQQMQNDLMAAQERLANATVEGAVAGGAVTVTVTGTGELVGVRIKPTVVSDPEDLEDNLEEIGDFVVAAYRAAKANADELARESMPAMPSMPDLPGGESGGPLGFR